MMSDPIDDAVANAQREAFKTVANVTPLRSAVGPRPAGPVCIGVDAFLAGTDAPVWVIGGLLQTNYVYALTAPTNHGKTAVSLVMALCVAAGRTFAGLPVTEGNVLILCGENQDGFRLRMMATMQSLEISLSEIKGKVWVLPQAGSLALLLDQIKSDATAMEPLAMVLVDTSVAFFSGDNENDNAQAYEHARYLRELSMLPGKPAVVANCHPAAGAGKDMTRDSCVPRGGSAFLSEIDTNLSVWSEGDFAELHWMRKKRGPDFAPILFEYRGVNIEQHDTVVASIVAVHIDEERQKMIRKKHKEHESRLLFEMNLNPSGTIRDWGLAAGFTIKTGHFSGQAHVSGVMRILERLKKYRLAERSDRDGWILTKAGKEEAQGIR